MLKPTDTLSIAIDRSCGTCQRSELILSAVRQLMKLDGQLTPEDVEDAALLACDGCAEDAQCGREGEGWILDIARADVPATA